MAKQFYPKKEGVSEFVEHIATIKGTTEGQVIDMIVTDWAKDYPQIAKLAGLKLV